MTQHSEAGEHSALGLGSQSTGGDLERSASPGEGETADADAAMTEYRDWVAAGRPGEKSHAAFMAELLTCAG